MANVNLPHNGIRVIYANGQNSIYLLASSSIDWLNEPGNYIDGIAIRLRKADGGIFHIRPDNVCSIETVHIVRGPSKKLKTANPLEEDSIYDDPLS